MTLEKLKIKQPKETQLSHLVANSTPSAWFDSALAGHPHAKKSMLLLKPRGMLKVNSDGAGDWSVQGKSQKIADPISFMEELVAPLELEFFGEPQFCGGMVGFLSYEFWKNFKITPRHFWQGLPLAYFMLIDSGICIDHETKESWIFSIGLDDHLKPNAELAKTRCQKIFQLIETIKSNVTDNLIYKTLGSNLNRSLYLEKIAEIKKRILRGDCYQVNFSQSFWAEGDFDPASLYLKLRQTSPAPQMCFFNLGPQKILSASPETLFEINPPFVRSFPIKGTLPRGKTPDEDKKLAQQLWESPKDNAELLMILDLVRNDLGKFCETGSVKVPQLKQLDSLPQVHHLFAEVEGKIRRGVSRFAPLLEMFPGGSIIGAPKQKGMEILSELEPPPRGIYTGSMGYIGFNGQSRFNIAIRTALLEGPKIFFSAGGGIVADSDPEKEYEETLHKARSFFETIGAIQKWHQIFNFCS